MKRKLYKLLVALLIVTTCPTADVQAESNLNTKNIIYRDITEDVMEETNYTLPKGPKENTLSSTSAILMDADTGLILYEKNSQKKLYPASITKILTALLCIENCGLNETVTFKESEVLGLESGASNIGTMVGETLTIEQCLYAIMLSSANEVCLGVADYIAGDITSFSDMMNQRAKSLGCLNTNFSNPNGLHSDDHYTCAHDMALIGKAALGNETFRKVTSTKVAYIPKTNKMDARPPLVNHHNMLYPYTTSSYLYDNCIGGKTGYTSMAQSTLVTFAERDGMTLICVVMKGTSSKQSSQSNIYTDTISLLDFGFENYESHSLTVSVVDEDAVDSPLFTKFNSFFDTQSAPLQMTNNGKITLPAGVDVTEAKKNVEFYSKTQQINGENVIGTVSYSYGEQLVGNTSIYFTPNTNENILATVEDIEFIESTYITGESAKKARIIQWIAIIICILFVFAFAYLYIRMLKRRRQLSRRRYRQKRRPRNNDLHF